MRRLGLNCVLGIAIVFYCTAESWSQESAKSSPPDTTPYFRALLPGDTAGPPPAKAGAAVPGANLVRQVDTVVNNTDPNLTNTDTFDDGETSIAVNPNNHNEIVISAFSGSWGTYPSYAPLWVSRDGGHIWAKDFTVGQPYNITTGSCPCDQTYDFGTVYTGGNVLYTVLLGSILAGSSGDNIYSGDIFDPVLQGNWAYYGSSGSTTETSNRLASSVNEADQPWMLFSPFPNNPSNTQKMYVAYTNFGLSPATMQVAGSDGGTPPHFPNAYDQRAGTALNAAYNPGHRIAVDPRNGWVYSLWQNCLNNCSTLAANPKEIEFMLNRSTDGNGLVWGLNGQSGGIPIVITYSTQPQPKFGTVNALLGGVLSGAVDPSTGDLYYVTGYAEDNTGTYNELAIVRVHDCGGGNVCSAPLTRVVSGAVQAALPSVAITRHGTIGVFYYTYDGMSSGFPQFSTWLAVSTDKGVTFNAQRLAQFLSPATDNGNGRQRVFGDYMQMKAVDNCFYGSYTGNGAVFGRSISNNDPIFFKSCVPGTADTHDFNGAGKSSILWRDTSGNVGLWLMNGATILQASGIANVPTVWSIVGQRDFNGDGDADILWQDSSGDIGLWLMNGTTISQATGIANIPTVWSVAGTGDFNGDGKGDILWHDTSGNIGMWLMNGTQIVQATGIANVPPSVWSIAGTGDFNGDGKTDILWINTSGQVAVWFMNGTQIVSTTGVAQAPPGWSIVGTGDFNGDGMSDILWRDGSGNVGIWLMNGAQVVSAQGVANVPTVWSVAETGDFNADGKSDILWRDTGGNVGVWFMNGTTITSATGIANVPTAWSIQGAGAD